MPNISCNSCDCSHNKNGGCVLSCVNVAGESAKTSHETFCESYCNTDAKNCKTCGDECVCSCSDIGCAADSCKYNSECICTATNICIEKDGACKTFKK